MVCLRRSDSDVNDNDGFDDNHNDDIVPVVIIAGMTSHDYNREVTIFTTMITVAIVIMAIKARWQKQARIQP